jgi:hypothetical protein
MAAVERFGGSARRGTFPKSWGPPPIDEDERAGWVRANAHSDMIERGDAPEQVIDGRTSSFIAPLESRESGGDCLTERHLELYGKQQDPSLMDGAEARRLIARRCIDGATPEQIRRELEKKLPWL